ncbi:hypothetical protein WAK64_19085 [Bacillus spongiae]|uniref:Uncharacterized protein n=1 Tax=Bacillus spongiae TaxID=2683610 RepID=A0ABU8HIQ1_9BACI
MNEEDMMEIFVESEHITLRKYQSYEACATTGEIFAENKNRRHYFKS